MGAAAIVIIDMLNYFAKEGDAPYRDRFYQVARNIASFKHHAAATGALSIYSHTQFDSVEAFGESAMARKSEPHWLAGTDEAAVIGELQPSWRDLIVTKTVNSAFFGTELEAVLRDRDVTRLFLTGVHTHVCVMLTAADAFYRNYDVVVVSDCVATIQPSRHVWALDYVDRHLGRVMTVAESLATLSRPGGAT